MTASSRTDRLFSALSAKERAVLVLRAWKEGGREDRQVRATTPTGQFHEFNHYIDLMNAVNQDLGRYLLVLRANVEQLAFIDGWLSTIKAWEIHAVEIGIFIFRRVPAPVTETEYARLRRSSRRKEPKPDRAARYEVFPDTDSDKVEGLASDNASIWNFFRRAPCGDFLGERDEPSEVRKLSRALVARLRHQTADCWQDLRAIEMLVGEAAEELGEDSAIPETRANMDWMHQELTDLRDKLKISYGEDVDLSDPADERLATLRQAVHLPQYKVGLSPRELVVQRRE